jgi:F-type H+-transporting ATPase subunit a
MPLAIVLLFMVTLYLLVFPYFNLVPNFWQFCFESLYLFMLDLIDQQIGSKGYIYLPLLFSLFFFVLSCNLLSMSPFGIALTSHLIIILFISVSLGLSNFFLVYIFMEFLF